MFAKLCILISLPCLFAIRDDGPQTFNGNSNRQQPHVVRYTEPDTPRAPPSAILTHKQGLTNDGVFNYIFAADNGLKQGESIAPDGTRTGAYEYIDPSGKTIYVKYTAGKDGFKILEGDHIPLQPQAVQPIDEYQSPEHRKDYKPPQQQNQRQQQPQSGNGKYKTDTEEYQEQYQPRHQEYREYQPQQQRNQQNQRYTNSPQKQYQPQPQLFQQANQNKGQGGQGRQQNERNRASLYNVEQRHNVNYRKYQDNGQPIGSGDYEASSGDQGEAAQPAGPHSYGRGYNFEFKG